jgi:hypothetical protein
MSTNYAHCPVCAAGKARLTYVTVKSRPGIVMNKLKCDSCDYSGDPFASNAEVKDIDPATWKFYTTKPSQGDTKMSRTYEDALKQPFKTLTPAERQFLGGILAKMTVTMPCPCCHVSAASFTFDNSGSGGNVTTMKCGSCKGSRWVSDEIFDLVMNKIISPLVCPNCKTNENVTRMKTGFPGKYYYSCSKCSKISPDFDICTEHKLDTNWIVSPAKKLTIEVIKPKQPTTFDLPASETDLSPAKDPSKMTLVEIAETIREFKVLEMVSWKTDTQLSKFAIIPLSTEFLVDEFVKGCGATRTAMGFDDFVCPKCKSKTIQLAAASRMTQTHMYWSYPDYLLICTSCGHFSPRETSKNSMATELVKAKAWISNKKSGKTDIQQSSVLPAYYERMGLGHDPYDY